MQVARKLRARLSLGLVSGEGCSLAWRNHLLPLSQDVLPSLCMQRENALCYLPSSYKIVNPDRLGTPHIGLHLSS